MFVYRLIVLVAFACAKRGPKPDGCAGNDDKDVVNPSKECPDIDPKKELNPDKYQGDIDNIPVESKEEERNMAISRSSKWSKSSDGYVYIPYIHDSTMSSRGKGAVSEAIADFNANTCIRFRPRRSEQDYVAFVRGAGCYSSMGRAGGRQALSLGGGCESKGTAIHEMIHALGFLHEQARPDRDDWITIIWSNISPGRNGQFQKGSTSEFTTLGLPYEYKSVMHYPETAFSRNNQPTMVAKDPSVRSLGQRMGFTRTDIRKINTLYNCGETAEVRRTSPPDVEPRTRPPTQKPSVGGGSTVCKDLSGSNNCQRRIQERPNLCSSRSSNLCLKSCGLC